jgi:hypothetical protein
VPIAADLDHVALAAEHAADQWPRYGGDLGGDWIGGADSPGFRFEQFRFANGMAVELLEPANIEQNDFLRRFLNHSGPGPHHLTDLLGGHLQRPAPDTAEVTWKGSGRLLLVQPAAGTPNAHWLGDRTGRVRDLTFRVDDPQTVPGARPVQGGYEVDPADNLGVRLVLV